MSRIKRTKYVLDATRQSPGRIATKIATILIGKHKVSYSTHLDNGDKVVVENADKITFTGKKLDQKDYKHHTMHPGGLKVKPAKTLLKESPAEVIRHAVVKMLPKNKLREARLRRLTFK